MEQRTAVALACLPLLFACATPIGVEHVGAREVHRALTSSVLTNREPSVATLSVLNREFLTERFRTQPAAVLPELHERFRKSGDAQLLFALAELCFVRAERERSRELFLASALYAFAFLFPEDAEGTSRFDPRFRLAADLYNHALALGLRSADGSRVELASGSFELPFGRLEIERDPEGFRWGGFQLVDFVSAAEFQIRGLRNRYRRPGLGAPLIAALEPDPDASELERRWIPPRLRVPATALLLLDTPWSAIAGGDLHARLELHADDSQGTVEIAGRSVPLEFEPTSSLAYTLEGSEIWDLELRGFFLSDLNPLPGGLDTGSPGGGLFMLQPYRPGQIPLVLVHGTASSPARWAEMVNELTEDPRIRDRYQIWLFTYNTGNPIAFSGALLREALLDVVAELDPGGRDPALRRMVVAGHSQGGLLTKLTVIDSGSRFWDTISDAPLDELEIEPETRELVLRTLFVQPVPYVTRVIFIATPHRGSFLAERRLGRIVSYFVTRPSAVAKGMRDLVDRNPDRIVLRGFNRVPSSIENMKPSNSFVRTLAEIPISAGVSPHSIIAVLDEPIETGNDGVVEFRSAHLPGVPKLVVRSGHSTQSHPETIAEVRRILLEHLQED